ncbi:UDP-N-acetylglucosamine 2-epimerase (non-hydrolyzing) [Sphaerisporangium cinnabarinum]|nr:UDP-N-acetylglucosamine 2-epimerase (non-hydrolyzing) [Sphaerisporangium cinnabarinum]PTU58158.1 UDP-N-acetylglucosamine 2-epimerase (non-hydrolyzing) [Sphaerisporangium cinnabarinum]
MTERRFAVMVVVGTRPEAIKMMPVIRELHRSAHFEPYVVSTGQHSRMVSEVLGAAGLRPDVDLGAGGPGVDLNQLVARVLVGIPEALRERFGEPDSVLDGGADTRYPVAALVHGDTSSAAAGALAAFHLRMPVSHVEAGLRTGSTLSPFPEELNRQLVTRIAAFHLAPTTTNAENLIHERVRQEQIFVTGNTGIDAFLWAAGQQVPYGVPALGWLETDEVTPVVVVTAHRRENWGTGLRRIGDAVATLADLHPLARFVVPLHPNPLVVGTLRAALEPSPNVILTSPLPYLPFARLLRRAAVVLTDSGGIQEEAPAVGTPVLVTRETTERQEGVHAGTLRLVGTDETRIVDAVTRLLTHPESHRAMSEARNPYGDGRAAERIVAALEHIAFRGPRPQRFGSGYARSVVLAAAGFTGPILDPLAPLDERGATASGPRTDARPERTCRAQLRRRYVERVKICGRRRRRASLSRGFVRDETGRSAPTDGPRPDERAARDRSWTDVQSARRSGAVHSARKTGESARCPAGRTRRSVGATVPVVVLAVLERPCGRTLLLRAQGARRGRRSPSTPPGASSLRGRDGERSPSRVVRAGRPGAVEFSTVRHVAPLDVCL